MSTPAPKTIPGDPLESAPVLVGRPDDRALTESLLRPVLEPMRKGWALLLLVLMGGMGFWLLCLYQTLFVGIGAWGNNIPVAWAYDITNFVWWIGIGHAGTLISAILLLFQQRWRTSINRFAEAMTLFAVAMAGMYPIIHLGRPWLFWWLIPYPATTQLWPNFKSALPWDVFAISTYATVSFLFWYLGLIPDLATLRDAAKDRTRRVVYGIMSFGWRGSARHWQHWRVGYLLLAGLSTPLVVSVHTIVSFDFAISQLPGWHTTIFPPYFVAGAIFSGFAMVLTLMIPARKAFGFEHVVTPRHLDNMAKVVLATGLMVSYGYAMEWFIAWYSGNPTEWFAFTNRMFGPYRLIFAAQMFCNVVAPQILWIPRARTNILVLFLVSILVNVGMWAERFVIIAVSLTRDFVPSSWASYSPTWVDWGLLFGSMATFGVLFMLFLRFIPAIPISEVKELRKELEHDDHHAAAKAAAGGGRMRSLVLGEFAEEAALLDAVRTLRAKGVEGLDLHSPYPLHGADEALGLRRSTVPLVTLVAGVVGAVSGYLLQWWTVGVAWPLNVGNRPPHSAPAFIPVTFELGILFASLGIFLGLLFGYFRFPRVHHPAFEVEAFRSATIDGLWLSASVGRTEADGVAAELRRLGARSVSIVPEVS